jgi:hypothetical protein
MGKSALNIHIKLKTKYQAAELTKYQGAFSSLFDTELPGTKPERLVLELFKFQKGKYYFHNEK